MGLLSGLPVWLIVTGVIVGVLILLFRILNQIYVLSLIKKNFFYIFLIGVLVFVTISLSKLHRTYDIDITSKEGIKFAGKVYYSWLVNIFKNVGRVTGYAVQQDWVKGPANLTG